MTYLERSAHPAGWARRALAATVLALVGALTLTLAAAGPADAAKRKRGVKVKTLTRNVYLGSGLDARNAPSIAALCNEAADTIDEVDSTNPPARMRAIANEILNLKPDLVGLQEVAAWYIQNPGDGRPPQVLGGTGTFATDARYDFLQLILNRLNHSGKKRYAAVVVGNEFEFESEVDLDHDDGTDRPGGDCGDAEADARMLIRDVILVRKRAGVRVLGKRKDNYDHQLQLSLAGGFPFEVKRGWEAITTRVRGSKKFIFANTHLEAFDSSGNNTMADTSVGGPGTHPTENVGRGEIRMTQALELVGPGGILPKSARVVLAGDLNSNVPGVQPGDHQAFQAVLNNGYKRRSTQTPPSCCVDDNTGTLTGGSLADFDHVVDHILANKKRIKRRASGVIGRAKVAAGRWPSDHAGVWSVLRLPR